MITLSSPNITFPRCHYQVPPYDAFKTRWKAIQVGPIDMVKEAGEAGPAATEAAPERQFKLSHVAYARFKESLFARRIPIGATVTQADLMELLDVPIGPLREALQVLENDGLVTMLPRTGIRIVKPDMSLLKESFQLRRVLEMEAVRKYGEVVQDEELARWDAAHRDVLVAAQSRMAEDALIAYSGTVDRGFHAALIGSLRNSQIGEVYDRMNERIRLVRLDNLYRQSTATVTQAMQEHLTVLDAVRGQDIVAAVAAIEDHLRRALHRAIGL
jgi:DNA-binding GntR family transcriptional regulator